MGLGIALRKHMMKKIHRQPYCVSQPHALWHIDGHHKLINWGIIVHGVVNGYTQLVSKSEGCPTQAAKIMFLDHWY